MLMWSLPIIDCVNQKQITLSNKLEKISSLLDPYFITGFSDGESCFYIGIRKTSKLKVGLLKNNPIIKSKKKKYT
jgi:hypothetical protein